MHCLNPSSRRVALFLLLGAFVIPAPARAQGVMGPPGFMNQGEQPKARGSEPLAPPPALPGAESKPGAAAPRGKLPLDMSPNDALFDAINRGDIGSARDALSRGADLRARNILGMTPLALAVDLGRNDISFLLLSMRGADASQEPAAAATSAPASPKSPAVGATTPRTTRQAARPTAAREVVSPPEAPRSARLFANDGGAPVPAAGFLGFDPGRAPR